MRNHIRRIPLLLGVVISRVLSRFRVGRILLEGVTETMRQHDQVVVGTSSSFRLAAPTPLIRWRNSSMLSKEPETIAWLDQIEAGATLWDVGANVGLYSVYAAKVRDCLVFAFEPSVFNLEFLARNIQNNGLVDRVVVVPLSLNDRVSVSRFELSTTAWGGALSTFEHGVTYDGSSIKTEFAYTTIGIGMDQLSETFGIQRPDYIKIDVDGIEHLVVRGGESVLRTCRSLLIEVNDDFDELAQSCSDLLTQAGLVLRSKEHSDDMATGRFANLYNQIWERA